VRHVQVDQAVQAEIDQAEIVQVVLADLAQVDRGVPAALLQVELADQVEIDQVEIDQVEIDQVALVDLVRLVPAVDLRAHQEELQAELRVADQAVVQIQPVVVVTRQVLLVNLAVVLQRVESLSVQSVKSSTT
jgi:hypothetical protein